MNKDKYGEIINGKETYNYIADRLKENERIIIGWTDEAYTHYDILFTTNCIGDGMLQGAIKRNDLFVSVMRWGSFGFKIDSEKFPGYVAEKLFTKNYSDESIDKLTELINGICEVLRNNE